MNLTSRDVINEAFKRFDAPSPLISAIYIGEDGSVHVRNKSENVRKWQVGWETVEGATPYNIYANGDLPDQPSDIAPGHIEFVLGEAPCPPVRISPVHIGVDFASAPDKTVIYANRTVRTEEDAQAIRDLVSEEGRGWMLANTDLPYKPKEVMMVQNLQPVPDLFEVDPANTPIWIIHKHQVTGELLGESVDFGIPTNAVHAIKDEKGWREVNLVSQPKKEPHQSLSIEPFVPPLDVLRERMASMRISDWA